MNNKPPTPHAFLKAMKWETMNLIGVMDLIFIAIPIQVIALILPMQWLHIAIAM